MSIVIEQGRGWVKLYQKRFTDRILQMLEMADCNRLHTPILTVTCFALDESPLLGIIGQHQQLLGPILYLSNTTRPYIAYATGYLSRQLYKPAIIRSKNAQHVLSYQCVTTGFELAYKREKSDTMTGYGDKDWAQEELDRKFIGACVFIFSNIAISWRSKMKDIDSQSTVEVEFIALAFSIREALWFRRFKTKSEVPLKTFNICIKEDSQGFISLAKDNMVIDRSKHIDIKYQFLVSNIRKTTKTVKYKLRFEMVADTLAKALHLDKFQYLLKHTGRHNGVYFLMESC